MIAKGIFTFHADDWYYCLWSKLCIIILFTHILKSLFVHVK